MITSFLENEVVTQRTSRPKAINGMSFNLSKCMKDKIRDLSLKMYFLALIIRYVRLYNSQRDFRDSSFDITAL